MTSLSPKDVASYIDHTALKQTTSSDDGKSSPKSQLPHFKLRNSVKRLSRIILRQFVLHLVGLKQLPKNLPRLTLWVRGLGISPLTDLASRPIGVASVVGFPHGNSLPEVKAFETKMVVEKGATVPLRSTCCWIDSEYRRKLTW